MTLQDYVPGKTVVSAKDMNEIKRHIAEARRFGIGATNQGEEGLDIPGQQSEQLRIMQLITALPAGGCAYAVPVINGSPDFDEDDWLVNEDGLAIQIDETNTVGTRPTVGKPPELGDPADPHRGDDLFQVPVYDIFNRPSWPMDRGLVIALPGSGEQRGIWVPLYNNEICFTSNNAPGITTTPKDADAGEEEGNPQQDANTWVIPLALETNVNRDLYLVTAQADDGDSPTQWQNASRIVIRRGGLYRFRLDLAATAEIIVPSPVDPENDPPTAVPVNDLKVHLRIGAPGPNSPASQVDQRTGIIGTYGGSVALEMIYLVSERGSNNVSDMEGVQIIIEREEFEISDGSAGGTNWTVTDCSLEVEAVENRHFYQDSANNNTSSRYRGATFSAKPPFQGTGSMFEEFDADHKDPEDQFKSHDVDYPNLP